MTVSTTVIAFPSVTSPSPRFDPKDRNAIVGAAMALSPGWGASFFLNDDGAELASVGPWSAGDDAEDRFGFAILGRGRIELLDFLNPEAFQVCHTVTEAVDAMKAAMARQDV